MNDPLARYRQVEKRLRELEREKLTTELEFRKIRNDILMELTQAPLGTTPRELQVLDLVRQGKQNKDIANELNIAVRTVKFHVSSLLRKFGVDSRGLLHAEKKGQEEEEG